MCKNPFLVPIFAVRGCILSRTRHTVVVECDRWLTNGGKIVTVYFQHILDGKLIFQFLNLSRREQKELVSLMTNPTNVDTIVEDLLSIDLGVTTM